MVDYCASITDASIDKLLENCPLLTEIGVKCTGISDATLVNMVQRLAEIAPVEFLAIEDDVDEYENNTLLYKSPTRRQLYGMCFRSNTNDTLMFSTEALLTIVQMCPLLLEIELMLDYADEVIFQLVERCPLLRKITLRQAPGMDYYTHTICQDVTTDFAMTYIADKCLKLTSLYASGVTDAAVISLVHKRGSQLTSLSVPGSYHLTDYAMEKVVEFCPQLTTLDVSGKNIIFD